MRKYLVQAHRQLGRIALLEERIPDAERHLALAAGQAGDLQSPLVAWRVHAAFRDLYLATGREDEARNSAGVARQILEALAGQAPEALGRSILSSQAYESLGS